MERNRHVRTNGEPPAATTGKRSRERTKSLDSDDLEGRLLAPLRRPAKRRKDSPGAEPEASGFLSLSVEPPRPLVRAAAQRHAGPAAAASAGRPIAARRLVPLPAMRLPDAEGRSTQAGPVRTGGAARSSHANGSRSNATAEAGGRGADGEYLRAIPWSLGYTLTSSRQVPWTKRGWPWWPRGS